jgi:hypothetical protein
MYVGQGSSQPIVQDSGAASGGPVGMGLSELDMIARGTGTAPYAAQGTGPYGTIDCKYDGPTTGPYHYLCLSPNAQGGALIAIGNGGGATTQGFNLILNGATYAFPFVVGGIVGPSTSVVNDAACWNNTTGTLLKDCGAFVTVGGNNTWTGTNNYTGPFQVNSVAQTFPASGNIVGTSDTQTLTNKSINAAQINSGTLPAVAFPALTGDVTNSAGTLATTISAGAVTNSKLAVAGSANTIKGAATSTAIADLAVPSCSGATNALQWVTSTGFQCGTLGATSAGWGLSLSAGVFSVSTTQPPYGYDVPVNLGLTASAGASALTINVVGANGSTPSATNPVSVPFRSTTLTTGTPVWTAITGALSLVIPSGATLGTSSSNVPFRLWIFLTYNSGTPELGAALCSISTQIYPCVSWETNRVTTTTISGLATSAGTLYATSGVSNDSVRIIGYCEYSAGLATAGSWASACTTLQLLGPGVKKPGDVIQTAYNSTVASVTTSNTYTDSATIPTIGGAAAAISQAITPTSAINHITIDARTNIQSASAGNHTCFLYNGSAVFLTTTGAGANATNLGGPCILQYETFNVSSATTYSLYFTGTVATGINGSSAGTQWWGGTGATNIRIQEIMGALEPSNDNNLPRSMVG